MLLEEILLSQIDSKSQKKLFNLATSRILNLYGLIISEMSARKKKTI